MERNLIKIETKDGFRIGNPDYIKKIYHLECNYCKKIFQIPLKRWNQGVGKCCSQKCLGMFYREKGNPNYKDGKRNGRLFWQEEIRKKALKVRGEKCEVCGYKKYPQALCAHHKISRLQEGKHTLENCLIVCFNCHFLIHRNIIDTNGKPLPKKNWRGIGRQK
ncbi:HNH endonuclease [Patescibacteria group bacterium]|nr:HNH endonuclease [Patescibacteria group bacterium]